MAQKQEASSDATVAELEKTLAGLQERWEAHALSGLGVYSAPEASDGAAAAESIADAAIPDWRGLNLVTLACIPSFLEIKDRLALRATSRTLCRACERGPAKAEWLIALRDVGMLGGANLATAEGDSLGSCYSRHMFMARGSAAKVFKAGKLEHGGVQTANRLRFKSPVVPLSDGTAVAFTDQASPHSAPSVALAVFDMSGLIQLGHVPITGAKHGKSLQRPVAVTSLQAAKVASSSSSQACVATMHRIAVVFSWRLGAGAEGEASSVGLREPSVGEVRWGEGGREVLRSASFVGFGTDAPVAVLMEGGKNGPGIEIYHKIGCEPAPAPVAGVVPPPAIARYALREVVPLAASKSGGLIPGALYCGTVALWATTGERAIDFLRIHPVVSSGDDSSLTGGTNSAAALFARAKQTAKKGVLRADAEAGAGLDMEATKWGYIVEDVDDEPGQPDLAKGDCILSIGGQALHGLDEETMNWRFGRNFGDGAEITVLAADQMKSVLDAEKGPTIGKRDALAEKAAAASVHRAEVSKRQRFMFSGRLEAWCVAASRDPPRMLAVLDNRLVLADLCDDGAMTREALSGLAKSPWKRPVEQIAHLHEASDVVLAGVAQGVLIWRVPSVIAPLNGKDIPAIPELLATVTPPPRCNIVGLSFGLGFTLSGAWAWIAGDLSGAGSDVGGAFDTWQVFTGRQRAPLEAAARRPAGRGPGLAGDAVSRAFASVGAATEAMVTALRAAVESSSGEGHPAAQALKAWAPKLRQEKMEPLYAALDRAEPVCSEAVRDLRRWLRAEGRGAAAARQDGARAMVEWIENCRRYMIWPLQVAFQAEEGDDDGEDLPTRQSMAANARGTGAAAGTVPRGQQ